MRSFQIKMVTQLERGEFKSINLKNDIFVKWLVGYMVDTRKPFRVIDMGSGITKVTLEGLVCPHCEGKGFFDHESECLNGCGVAAEGRRAA